MVLIQLTAFWLLRYKKLRRRYFNHLQKREDLYFLDILFTNRCSFFSISSSNVVKMICNVFIFYMMILFVSRFQANTFNNKKRFVFLSSDVHTYSFLFYTEDAGITQEISYTTDPILIEPDMKPSSRQQLIVFPLKPICQ